MVHAEGNGANVLFMASTKEHLSKPWRKSWSAMVCAMVCVMRCPTSVERKGTNERGGYPFTRVMHSSRSPMMTEFGEAGILHD